MAIAEDVPAVGVKSMNHRILFLPAVLLGVLNGWGCSEPPTPAAAGTVVVVHGLGRSGSSMAMLGSRLESAGYRVVRVEYPSTSEPIEALVDSLAASVASCCGEAAGDIHFVAHSMGGILVRAYLAQRVEPYSGRVVMLSPPNQGSEIVDAFADSRLLRAMIGPAGMRLGTDSTGIGSELPAVDFSLGIITGDRSVSPVGSWLIPGPDDGKVGVERARVAGATDFIVVPATHTFIMNRRDVAEHVIQFLSEGRFHSGDSSELEGSVP